MKRALDAVRALLNAVTPSPDVAATAQTFGPSIEAAFTFVRDQIAFDPYPGSQRGAEAALMLRAANDIDRSVLLAALLAGNGQAVRLVRGTLSPAAASKLLAQASRAPGTPKPSDMSVGEIARITGLAESAVSDRIAKAQAGAKDLRGQIDARVRRHLEGIQKALQAAGVAIESDSVRADSLRPHVWLQVQSGAKWIDLDSSFSDAAAGQSFATVAGAPVSVASMPDDWFQKLAIQITVHRQGRGTSETVLKHEWKTSDLLLAAVSMAFSPIDGADAAKATSFEPLIVVDKDVVKGQPIVLKPAHGDQVADALGGGAEEAADEQVSDIEMVVSLSAPGLPIERSVRTLAAAAPNADAAARLVDLRDQVVSGYNFLVAAGPIPMPWLLRQEAPALAQLVEPDPQNVAIVPGNLMSLASAMTTGDTVTGAARRYYPRPLVVSQRLRFRHDADGQVRFLRGLDILHNHVAFLGGDPLLAIQQGVLETELERSAFFPSKEVFNTATVFERAGSDIRVLRSGDDRALTGLEADAAVKARIADDLASGYVVIIPAAPVQISAQSTTGWWRVRTRGGQTLGRMASGDGQGFVETVIKVAAALALPGYSTIGGVYCQRSGSTAWFCNPCLLAIAGGLSVFQGILGMAMGGSILLFLIGDMLGGGLGTGLSLAECASWYTGGRV